MPSGPTVSMEVASGYTPSSGTRPQVVFRPVIPQQAAGIRTEPPVSVPRATSASPVATATAEPLDEPPGSRPGSSGFGGVPSQEFTPLADQHSSVRLVLPTIRAPVRRAAATTGASRSAGPACSAIAWQPAVVGRPSMSMQSLTASRGPPPGASSRITQMESMRVNCHGSFAWKSRRLRCPDRLVSHRVSMRVAIITESFPPDVNGVAHSVAPRRRTPRQLRATTRWSSPPQPPRKSRAGKRGADSYPFPVVRVPAVPLPGYPGFRLGLPGRTVRTALVRHRADVVHLASPFVPRGARRRGGPAARPARPSRSTRPTSPSYARAYRLGRAGEAFAWRWLARHPQRRRAHARPVHGRPRPACSAQGIGNVWLWGRGVDTRRFDPARRSAGAAARSWRRAARCSSGYVGRLATEKRVELLAGDHRAARRPAGHRRRRAGRGHAAPAAARAPSSWASGGARSWPASTPASTSSCTPGRTRRSARRCRRRRPAGCRWWPRPPAGRSTWWRTGVTGYLVPPATPDAFAAAVAGWPPIRRRARRSARPGGARSLGRSWAALIGDELIGHYAPGPWADREGGRQGARL